MIDFEAKAEMLGDLWLDYKDDEVFKDFIDYNDIGLPLAYAVGAGLVQITEQGTKYIEETWALLLEALGADPEYDYESLDDLLEQYPGELPDYPVFDSTEPDTTNDEGDDAE